MQDGAITWANLAAIIAMLGGLGGVVKWIVAALGRRDAAIAAVRSELQDFKVLVAQSYAPVAAMNDGLQGVYGRLDKMNDRLDNLVTALAKQHNKQG